AHKHISEPACRDYSYPEVQEWSPGLFEPRTSRRWEPTPWCALRGCYRRRRLRKNQLELSAMLRPGGHHLSNYSSPKEWHKAQEAYPPVVAVLSLQQLRKSWQSK